MMKWKIAGFVVVFLLLLYGAWALSGSWFVQLFTPIVRQVTTQEKVIALTIDDGPNDARTDQIVHLFDSLQVKATFFVTGHELMRNPENGQKLVSAGHELANHSWSHRRMVLKSTGFIDREIRRTDSLLNAVGQPTLPFFRAPGCKKLVLLPWYLWRHGRQMIGWNIAPDSVPGWKDETQIVQNAMQGLAPGSIVLMHLWYRSRKASLRALPEIVAKYRAAGYRFVTLSELMVLKSE